MELIKILGEATEDEALVVANLYRVRVTSVHTLAGRFDDHELTLELVASHAGYIEGRALLEMEDSNPLKVLYWAASTNLICFPQAVIKRHSLEKPLENFDTWDDSKCEVF